MVHKKLMQARILLQNAPLKKSGHNKFAGYSYFELGDFMPEINAIFNEVGLCGVVSYDSEIASLTITDTDDGTNIIIRQLEEMTHQRDKFKALATELLQSVIAEPQGGVE